VGDFRLDVESALTAFLPAAALAGHALVMEDLEVVFCPAPHDPPRRLPAGRMAIYGFWAGGRWLKIGKAGQKSAARYT